MLKPCPKCNSTNVVNQIGWDEFSKDLCMHTRCVSCGLEGPRYTYGKQGRDWKDEDFNKAERLSVEHWNAEAHR